MRLGAVRHRKDHRVRVRVRDMVRVIGPLRWRTGIMRLGESWCIWRRISDFPGFLFRLNFYVNKCWSAPNGSSQDVPL